MTTPYYNTSGNPTPGAAGLSATMRAEFSAIATAFALLPAPLSGNANKVIVVNSSGTGLTVSSTPFPGPSGPYLPLVGGTVVGATIFSASGTGLTVNNNAFVGGSLTVTGGIVLGPQPTTNTGLATGTIYLNGEFLCRAS